MRLRVLLPSIALLLAACGGGNSSSPDGGTTGQDGGTPIVTCDASLKPVGTPVLPPASQVLHHGVHRVGESVPFAVPAGAVSLTVVEQAVSAPDFVTAHSGSTTVAIPNTAVPLDLFGPQSATAPVVTDRASSAGTAGDPVQSLGVPPVFSPATGTLTIPNTTGGLQAWSSGLPAGGWSLVVSDLAYECKVGELFTGVTCPDATDASSYDVTVIAKVAGGALPSAGSVDFAFYLVTNQTSVPASPLPSASGAASDPDLARMVDKLRNILQTTNGITVGNVTFHDVPADVKAQYGGLIDVSQTGACTPLPQLLKNAQPGKTMNLFLVAGFKDPTDTTGTTTVGIDGTIPGPATFGGTIASGAAVATISLRAQQAPGACSSASLNLACGDDLTAFIIAHETGHFLGLYHTVEAQGLDFDPIADTLTCPCSSCKATTARDACQAPNAASNPSAHVMQVSECSGSTALPNCGGGDDLMFWLLDPVRSKPLLTPQQKSVVLANPLLQ